MPVEKLFWPARKPGTVRMRFVGLSSAVPGSDLHSLFLDLDSRKPEEEPERFEAAVRALMRKKRLTDVYLFRTAKGFHIFSPNAGPVHDIQDANWDFTEWGADEFHRVCTGSNGNAVIRVTGKPVEGDGPKFVKHFQQISHDPKPVAYAHWKFFNDLRGVPMFMPGVPEIPGDEVVLETYWSYADAE